MRHMTFSAAFLGAILMLGLCGCGKNSPNNVLAPSDRAQDPQPEHVVAMVNGTPLTWAEMDKRAMGFLKDDVESNHLIIPSNRLEEAKEHFRRKSVNAFVFKTVMMEEASKQGLKLTDADRREGLKALAVTLKTRNWTTNDFFLKGPMNEATMRREFEDGMIIDKLLKVNVRSALKVSDAEIAAAIKMLDATNSQKRVVLEGVRKQLLEGAPFEDVARNVSECPSAKKGGDLGEFARGKMLKAFDDVAFAQDVGTISPVFQTRFGYHVLKVTAHSPAKAATGSTPAIPETVRVSHILLKSIPVDRKRISDSILRTKYNAATEAYFRELKAKAKIECLLYKDMKF